MASNQVIRELRNTKYRPRTSVLGSRQQFCVHPEVSKLRGAAQNTQCQKLVGANACKFHNKTQVRDPVDTLPSDILARREKGWRSLDARNNIPCCNVLRNTAPRDCRQPVPSGCLLACSKGDRAEWSATFGCMGGRGTRPSIRRC